MPRPPSFDPALLSLRLQASGPASAQTLAAGLNVDRLTVQRALRGFGAAAVKLGTTRGTRYALRRAVHGQSEPLEFSRLGQNGVAHDWGRLTALHGGWHLEWASPAMRPDWADQVHDHAGFCDGVPFFIADLRPQGFLGRAIARQLPGSLGLPPDPRNWSDDQTLFYLREWGDDLPGNVILGRETTRRAVSRTIADAVTLENRAERYPALAGQANAGGPVGSSVEGEQPKFTAWLSLPDQERVFAVLVKFTDTLDTPTGRRWADLLAAEAIALDVLTSASRGDADGTHPQTFDLDGRRFYELPRYDRVGVHGRRGVVSLRALHDAGFTGRDTNDWSVAAAGLYANGWLGESDLRAVRLRQLFGRLIGNTDMHFGNLALFLEPELPLRLAPTYDMLPMLWAPQPGNATPAPEFTPAAPISEELEIWPEAARMAEEFWRRVEGDARVSENFRLLAVDALGAVRTLRARFG
jgi:hypothetical protein